MSIAMETRASLGKRIELARVNADMRQQDLAEIVRVSRGAITQWETGRTEPSASKIVCQEFPDNESAHVEAVA